MWEQMGEVNCMSFDRMRIDDLREELSIQTECWKNLWKLHTKDGIYTPGEGKGDYAWDGRIASTRGTLRGAESGVEDWRTVVWDRGWWRKVVHRAGETCGTLTAESRKHEEEPTFCVLIYCYMKMGRQVTWQEFGHNNSFFFSCDALWAQQGNSTKPPCKNKHLLFIILL